MLIEICSPSPTRSIIDRFPKPIQLNLIGTWYQKIGGWGGILYVACTWTLAALFWIGHIQYNSKIYCRCMQHSGIFLSISSPFFLFQALSPQLPPASYAQTWDKDHLWGLSTAPWWGGTPHMKGVGMLVILLRGINFGFRSHLGCPGQNAVIFSCEGLL